jgi:acyl carrier protein
MKTRDDILNDVIAIIHDVVDEDWLDDIDITLTTSFNDDLELESIEIVAFAEKLKDVYGDQVRFVDWLSSKDLNAIIHLSVGDVVSFVDDSLRQAA